MTAGILWLTGYIDLLVESLFFLPQGVVPLAECEFKVYRDVHQPFSILVHSPEIEVSDFIYLTFFCIFLFMFSELKKAKNKNIIENKYILPVDYSIVKVFALINV